MVDFSELTDEEILELTKDWTSKKYLTDCRRCGVEFEAFKNERYCPDCREEGREHVIIRQRRTFFCRGTLRIWREDRS